MSESTVIKLKNEYPCKLGSPTIHSVDTAIFKHRYFTKCLSCQYCGHSCCNWGVDVDFEAYERIKGERARLEPYMGSSFESWFSHEWEANADYPGGKATRTSVVDGTCVFQNKDNGLCKLHAFALDHELDYHFIKPLIASLFPLTFGDGTMVVAEEIEEGSLACLGAGPSCYEGVRDEVLFFWGEGLVAELDELAKLHGPALSPAERLAERLSQAPAGA
jgi:hypothetical protein